MLNNRYQIYYESEDIVCIKPDPTMSFEDMDTITQFFYEKGFQYWIPGNQEGAYRFAKHQEINSR